MKISIKQLVSDLLKNLPPRQRNILELRYGLRSPQTYTLAEIGEKYGVTRERIRQLETLALKQVIENSKNTDYSKFINLVVDHLKKLGGVQREDYLIEVLLEKAGEEDRGLVARNMIKFLLDASDQVFHHSENDDFYAFWHLGDSHKEKVKKEINNLYKKLAEKQEVLMGIPSDLHFVSIAKSFAVSPFGEFGLAKWEHIQPKTARAWAYLVLKKEKRPLHFSELAKLITSLRGKKTNPQTVHNELIKDSRFVLVGKGIYALKEHGYEPGTAREIIAGLIKKNGPMRSRQIINCVLKQRIFKENTILINLQNKKYFKRLADGRYTLA